MTTPALNPLGITHERRVANFAACCAAVGAPSTADHFAKLGDRYYRDAKRPTLRLKSKTSSRHRLQRFGALVSARAFFTLARRAVV